jgi:hypothetical protein
MNTFFYPSVVATKTDFTNNKGIEFKIDGKTYLVGGLAMKQREWVRPLNAKPNEAEWQALLYSALLQIPGREFAVVLGCPHKLRQVFADKLPNGEISIELPSGSVEKKVISKIAVVPECAGHALAYKEFLTSYESVIVISVGYGTVEVGAADSGGVIQDSLHSLECGLHLVSGQLQQELFKLGHERPDINERQIHHWDEILKQIVDGSNDLVIRRRNEKPLMYQDLRGLSDQLLRAYTERLIYELSTYFEQRYHHRHPVVLTGGGVLHPIVRETLTEYLQSQRYDVLETPPRELLLSSAALGYKSLSEHLYKDLSKTVRRVGIDIGNNTLVAVAD